MLSYRCNFEIVSLLLYSQEKKKLAEVVQCAVRASVDWEEAMDCATIVKRGYLFDKKMGILPVTTVS